MRFGMLSPGAGVDCDEADCDGSLGCDLALEGDCVCFADAIDLFDLDSSLIAFAMLAAEGFWPAV
jgi:hypothetical protein